MKKIFLAISLISLFGITIIESQPCGTDSDCNQNIDLNGKQVCGYNNQCEPDFSGIGYF